MKNNTLHSHDISDRTWNIIEPHLPSRIGTKSRPAQDNRRFTRWRDEMLPELLEEIRTCGEQKGAKHENTYSNRFIWNASTNYCYKQ